MATASLWGQAADSNEYGLQERWNNYLERTYSWQRIGGAVAETAFADTFRLDKCGRPPYCFPHHLGGALMRRTARTSMEFGVGALLKEDIRRKPSGLPGFRQRIVFALVHAPLAKGPDGEWRPAYSRFAGTLGAVAVEDAWRGHPLSTRCIATSFAWSASSYFQDALYAEFEPDMKRIGRRIWQNRIRPALGFGR